jgi:hypothetical protein
MACQSQSGVPSQRQQSFSAVVALQFDIILDELPAEKHHVGSRVPHTAVAIHGRQVDLLTPSTLPILVRPNWIPAREKPGFLIVIVRRPLLDTNKGCGKPGFVCSRQ